MKSLSPLRDKSTRSGRVQQPGFDRARSVSKKQAAAVQADKASTATKTALLEKLARREGPVPAGSLKDKTAVAERKRAALEYASVRLRGDGAGAGGTFCNACGFVDVDCGGSYEGVLDAVEDDGCRLGDGTLVDMHRIVLGTAQTLTVNLSSPEFNPYLLLTDEACQFSIFENDNCADTGGPDACFSVDLPAGTYFIMANGFTPEDVGAYTLTIECSEITTCVDCEVGAVVVDEPAMGELADGDCDFGDGTYLDIWTFEVAEAGVFSVEMSSEAVDTFLLVYGDDCIPFIGNDDCTPGDFSTSCLIVSLDVGAYFIGANNFNPGESGPYTLSVTRLTEFDCVECREGSAPCGETTAGALTTDDCIEPVNTAFTDLWEVTVDQAGPIVIDLESDFFDTVLVLFDEACNELAFDDDGGVGLNSSLTIELEPGTYLAGATSFAAGAIGDYTLTVACPDVALCRECTVGTVECGTPAEGSLAEGDCALDDGSFFDGHELVLDEGQFVDIQLTSTAFDTFLVVLDDFCEPVFINDDCEPGNFDVSCVSGALPPGVYTVGVTSFSGGETGDYTLSVDCRPVDLCLDCLDGDIACNEALDGEITPEDCTRDDNGRSVDVYRLELVGETQNVEIALNSGDFDTLLYLQDADCNQIALNDDGGPGLNSLIIAPLAEGTYYIYVSQFAAGTVGAYNLAVTCENAADVCIDCEVGTVECDEPALVAAFPVGTCTGPRGDQSMDLYSFEVLDPGQVTISLSADYDTYLHLFDESCVEIDRDDDGGEGLNSFIEITLEPGTYYAGASSFGVGAAGTLNLEITCGGDCAADVCVLDDVACGEVFTGTFPDPESVCTRPGGQVIQYYQLEIGQDGLLDIQLRSVPFDTYLILYQGSPCNEIARNDDCEPGNFDLSCLSRDVTAGTYFVGVSSFSAGEAGEFELEITGPCGSTCEDCVVGSVEPGGSANGDLGAGDCADGDGASFDLYTLQLASAYQGTISLESGDFDTIVALRDAACSEIARNDDCDAGTLNSCLEVDLPAGNYYVVVTSFEGGSTGAYTLSLSGGVDGVGPFLRGDCNGDGLFTGQVTDAVYLLNYNFSGGPVPPCAAACDANGDGAFAGSVTDAVYMLNFNFLGGPAPVAPYPDCTTSSLASDTALGCVTPTDCN